MDQYNAYRYSCTIDMILVHRFWLPDLKKKKWNINKKYCIRQSMSRVFLCLKKVTELNYLKRTSDILRAKYHLFLVNKNAEN